MEYPVLDRRLKLMMLIQQSLEEALALGIENPRLEFREEASGLRIRAAGTDAGEEIRYKGAEDEEVGGVLKSIAADGYVEVELGGEHSAGTGFIVITEKGLERIRHRRAFESNLPRVMKDFYVTLQSESEIVFEKLWRANWEGRNISVRNRQVMSSRKREGAIDEYLNVDDRFPSSYKVKKSRFSKDLYGEFGAVDKVHKIHAHVGLTVPFLKTGCLVAVDGVVIGGDVGKKFIT